MRVWKGTRYTNTQNVCEKFVPRVAGCTLCVIPREPRGDNVSLVEGGVCRKGGRQKEWLYFNNSFSLGGLGSSLKEVAFPLVAVSFPDRHSEELL